MKILTGIFLLFIAFANLKHLSKQLTTRNWYFSSISGNDTTGDGTIAKPYRSISRLNAIFPVVVGSGDSIFFKRGETFKTTTGIIVSQDNIFIGAYDMGNRPVISGTISLTQWYATSRTNIWICGQVLNMDSINLVTVNNQPVQMGRWPNLDNNNGGYNIIKKSTDSSITQRTWTGETADQPTIHPGSELVFRATKFFTTRSIVSKYTSPTAIIRLKWTDQMDFAGPPANANSDTSKWGYFFQNDSTLLDVNTEWYYNRSSKKLEMFSTTGMPGNVQAAASVNLLTFNSTIDHLTISDINFDGCDQDALLLTAGSFTTISNCVIENAGRNGINVNPATNVSILNNSILNSLSKGIALFNGAHYCTIKNNFIRNSGQLIGHGSGNTEDGHSSFSGDGVYIYHSGNAKKADIEYNQIINSGYAAIHFGRSDSTIVKYNYCDTACNVNDDGGIIYTYTGSLDTSHKGRQIISNIVLHGIGVPYGSGNFVAGAGIAAIYNDRGSNNIIQDSNYCAYCEKGIFMNYGCINMKVRNNTLFNNSHQLQVNTRSGDITRLNVITKNICYSAATNQVCFWAYSDTDTSLLRSFGIVDSNYYLRPLSSPIFTATIMHRQGKKPDGKTYSADISLTNWQNAYPYDGNSHISPFTYASTAVQDTSLRVEYNPTSANKTIPMLATYADVYGISYNRTITLPKYKNALLNKTSPLLPDELERPVDENPRIKTRRKPKR